jgi:hypothetical protein
LKKLSDRVRNKVTSTTNEIEETNETTTETTETETLVFPVHYFEGIAEFKNLVHSLSGEFQQLIGDTRIMFAMKKGSSLQ